MKSSLERTAILCKDVLEQPEGKYVILLIEANVTVTCDRVRTTSDMVIVLDSKDNVVLQFPHSIPYLMIDQERADIVTREAQLRRRVDNVKAEKDLMSVLGIGEDGGEIGGKLNGSSGHPPQQQQRPDLYTGQYA